MKKILFIGGFIVLLFTAHGIAQPIPPNAGEEYVLVNEWNGGEEIEENKLWNPMGIAVDSTGNVYVADMDNHRIQKFTSDGEFIRKWGWYGPSDGEMRFPSGIAVDTAGNVYVTDKDNYRVQKFTADGDFIAKWGTEVVPRGAIIDEDTGEEIRPESADCRNREDGQFLFPEEIRVDAFGNNLYIIDNCYIQRYSLTGQFIKNWRDSSAELAEGDTGIHSIYVAFAIDSTGNIYLNGPGTQESYHYIYKYTSEDGFITKWGSGEEGETTPPVGEFLDLRGIALDSSDNVYVVDRGVAEGIRIQKFTPIGQFLTEWTTDRKEDLNPIEVTTTGIAIDKTGNVYILNGNSIQKFAISSQTTTTIPGGTTTTTVPGTKPKASFTRTPSTGNVSTSFTFDASGSTDNESTSSLLAVRWDWEDDGTWDTEYTTTKIATHQYSVAGFYTIRLEVKDPQGLTNTASKKIIVWAQPQLCATSYLLGRNDSRLGTLRKFRDNVLAESRVGIKMIELYYRNGEKIIGMLEKSPLLKKSAQAVLERIISSIENQ